MGTPRFMIIPLPLTYTFNPLSQAHPGMQLHNVANSQRWEDGAPATTNSKKMFITAAIKKNTFLGNQFLPACLTILSGLRPP